MKHNLYERACQSIRDEITGMTEEDAMEALQSAGWCVRVVRHNGENFVGTCDMHPHRVNLALRDGRVEEVVSFG